MKQVNKLVSWELARAATILGLRIVPVSGAQDDILIVTNGSDVDGYSLSRLLIAMIDRIEQGTLKKPLGSDLAEKIAYPL